MLFRSDFYRVDDVYAPNLAVFRDGESAPFPGAPDGPVTDISVTERGLIVVGNFSSAGGHCSNHIAEWWGRGLSLPVMGPAGGGGATPRITEVRMLAPSPNPFNPRVTLAFELPRSGEVDLKIYDLAGRFVRNVLSESRAAGRHQFVWDGVDESGRPVSSGVYLAVLVADGRRDTVKMALVR